MRVACLCEGRRGIEGRGERGKERGQEGVKEGKAEGFVVELWGSGFREDWEGR